MEDVQENTLKELLQYFVHDCNTEFEIYFDDWDRHGTCPSNSKLLVPFYDWRVLGFECAEGSLRVLLGKEDKRKEDPDFILLKEMMEAYGIYSDEYSLRMEDIGLNKRLFLTKRVNLNGKEFRVGADAVFYYTNREDLINKFRRYLDKLVNDVNEREESIKRHATETTK